MAENRFGNSNMDDVLHLKEASSSKNTKKSTNTWVKTFESWGEVRGVNRKIYEIPEKELNELLERFYAELRKVDGNEYEPACLRVMISALDR